MNEIKRLINIAIEGKLDVVIHYLKPTGEESVRRLSDVKHPLGRGPEYIEGFCHLRQEIRNFKIERILRIELYNPHEDKPVPNMSTTSNPQSLSPTPATQPYVLNPSKSRFYL